MRLLICEMEKSNHVIIDLYFEPLLLSLRSLKVHFSHIFSCRSLFYIMKELPISCSENCGP